MALTVLAAVGLAVLPVAMIAIYFHARREREMSTKMPEPIIETERLILRPFRPEDAEELYRLVYADPVVRDPWSGYRETLEQFRRRFAEASLWRIVDGFGFRAVGVKVTGTLIGLMGFQRHEDGEGMFLPEGDRPVASDLVDVELTYAIGRDHWKKGYATEAATALVDEGFNRMGIERIVNWVDPENGGSMGLMQRLGFRIEPNRDGREKPGVLGILERTTWKG